MVPIPGIRESQELQGPVHAVFPSVFPSDPECVPNAGLRWWWDELGGPLFHYSFVFVFLIFCLSIYLFDSLVARCHFLFNILVEGSLGICSVNRPSTLMTGVYTTDDGQGCRPTEIIFPNTQVPGTSTPVTPALFVPFKSCCCFNYQRGGVSGVR